jgi:chromate transport protein ChrA
MPALLPGITAAGATTAAGVAASFGLWPMFLIFVKIGSVLFGSGYVLLVFLRADLVDRLHWLTEGELLDAIAIGQITPGPVFTTATFIGFILSGVPGALVATAGIFLPAFFFVAISGPLVPLLRRSPTAGAFLDGVNSASLALMAVVMIQLARTAFVDYGTIAFGIAAAVLLLRYNVNTTWLVLGGTIGGIVIHATNFNKWFGFWGSYADYRLDSELCFWLPRLEFADRLFVFLNKSGLDCFFFSSVDGNILLDGFEIYGIKNILDIGARCWLLPGGPCPKGKSLHVKI